MLAQSSLQLGRFVQGASSLTGHALGAVTTTAAAGAARLVAGVAGGAASAYHAARSIDIAPATPPQRDAESVDDTPVRPRALEEYDVSEAGTAELGSAAGAAAKPSSDVKELLAGMRKMHKQMQKQQQMDRIM